MRVCTCEISVLKTTLQHEPAAVQMRPTLNEGSEGRQRVDPEVWRPPIDFTCEISSVNSTLTEGSVVWSKDC